MEALQSALLDLIAWNEKREVRPSLAEFVRQNEEEQVSNAIWLLLSWLVLCYAGIDKGPMSCVSQGANNVAKLLASIDSLNTTFDITSQELDFRSEIDIETRRKVTEFVWSNKHRQPVRREKRG